MSVKYEFEDGKVITAENAASEETLQAILNEIAARSPAAKKQKKADEVAAKAADERAKADQEGAKTTKQFNAGLESAKKAAVKGLIDIGLTATSVAARYATNFTKIAEDPIKETAKTLNTAIDATANFTGALAAAIPFFGPFIKAAVDVGAELLKATNDALAEQLDKNIRTLQTYNKVGISFSGSLDEMNRLSRNAGLGLETFSKVVAANKAELNFLGMAGSDAATMLSKAMNYSTTALTKGGQTVRKELFKMGYTIEEQGGIFATTLATMSATGKLQGASNETINEQARKYAANLKIISDFTGQDAKKLMDRARQQQMMVALRQKLSAEELESLGGAVQMLQRMGPEGEVAIRALTQKLLLNTTSETAYVSGPFGDMINEVMGIVKSGKTDLAGVGNALAKAQEAANSSSLNGAISLASAFNVTTGSISEFNNALVGINSMGLMTKDAVAKMAKAIEEGSTLPNKTLDATTDLYLKTQEHQVKMEQLIFPHLEQYASILETANAAATKTTETLVRFATTGKLPSDDTAENTGPSLTERASKAWKDWSISDLWNNAETDNTLFNKQQAWMKQQGIVRIPGGDYQKADGTVIKSKDIINQPGYPKYAKGGTLGAGKFGIAGENGPELISGPASILSTLNTKDLGVVIDKLKGFEEYSYVQLEKSQALAENYKQTQQPERNVQQTNAAETNMLLSELIRLMRTNVDQVTRVAMNTN